MFASPLYKFWYILQDHQNDNYNLTWLCYRPCFSCLNKYNSYNTYVGHGCYHFENNVIKRNKRSKLSQRPIRYVLRPRLASWRGVLYRFMNTLSISIDLNRLVSILLVRNTFHKTQKFSTGKLKLDQERYKFLDSRISYSIKMFFIVVIYKYLKIPFF